MVEIVEETSKDALGLDLNSLKIGDDQSQPAAAEKASTDKEEPQSAVTENTEGNTAQPESAEVPQAATEPVAAASEDQKAPPREKKKPYINPERVKTGGVQREKLSEDELAQRMVRIREQNERIKQRRADVEADEQSFRKTQEAERQKQARTKKVQEGVNQAREQNARRKLDKIQNREWDSGKPGVKRSTPVEREQPSNIANQPPAQTASIGIRGGIRGGGGRGRGRGRGGGPPHSNTATRSPVTSPTEEKSDQASSTPTPAPAPAAPTAAATEAST